MTVPSPTCAAVRFGVRWCCWSLPCWRCWSGWRGAMRPLRSRIGWSMTQPRPWRTFAVPSCAMCRVCKRCITAIRRPVPGRWTRWPICVSTGNCCIWNGVTPACGWYQRPRRLFALPCLARRGEARCHPTSPLPALRPAGSAGLLTATVILCRWPMAWAWR